PSTPDEPFKKSLKGAFYAQQFAKIEADERFTDVSYDERHEVETWWDIGIRDATSIWFVQRIHSEIRVIDFYENTDE
ncbi:hypothetical protein ACXIUK_23730, partial [Vibrio parahaemolyticus]